MEKDEKILQNIYLLGKKALLTVNNICYLVDFDEFVKSNPKFYQDKDGTIYPSNYSHIFKSYKINGKKIEFCIEIELKIDLNSEDYAEDNIRLIRLYGNINDKGKISNWFTIDEDGDIIQMYLNDELCSSTINIITAYLQSLNEATYATQRKGLEITYHHYLH